MGMSVSLIKQSETEMCVEEHVRHLADKCYDCFFVCFLRKKLDAFITKSFFITYIRPSLLFGYCNYYY